MELAHPAHAQSGHQVRLEWGPTGAAAIGSGADVAVVVDVLSFTTTVTVAVEQGIAVHPFRWRDERAAAYADEVGATLAVGRSEALGRAGVVSLSPASLTGATGVERLVLPSPNGSTISAALADGGATVVAACLRNAAAVAGWLRPRVADGAVVAVIASGERWPDGSLRPAAEDLWGAGAVVAGLPPDLLSPEAELARAAWAAVAGRCADVLAACASGQELIAGGFPDDVAVAAEVQATEVVPLLADEAFQAAT